MGIEYKRTDNSDIFLEIMTQSKELSLSKLKEELSQHDKFIADVEQEKIPIPESAAAKERAAFEFYNMQFEDMGRFHTDEKQRLEELIAILEALPKEGSAKR